ncbi:hypothetical protein [Halomicronema hongdechloris]|uniref:hypothetical protein n=1 Tax=Halomicronema hongdechloris TaxID=1209493 RepID=UPI0010CB151F|nr:hypothetical protein [Halomicronema hongdechloris]
MAHDQPGGVGITQARLGLGQGREDIGLIFGPADKTRGKGTMASQAVDANAIGTAGDMNAL